MYFLSKCIVFGCSIETSRDVSTAQKEQAYNTPNADLKNDTYIHTCKLLKLIQSRVQMKKIRPGLLLSISLVLKRAPENSDRARMTLLGQITIVYHFAMECKAMCSNTYFTERFVHESA